MKKAPRGRSKDSENVSGNRKNKDLTDSPRDAERLRADESTIDLPDVRDIPGQEHIHVPALGELADTTISSADEEGAGILDDPHDDDEGVRPRRQGECRWARARVPLRSGHGPLPERPARRSSARGCRSPSARRDRRTGADVHSRPTRKRRPHRHRPGRGRSARPRRARRRQRSGEPPLRRPRSGRRRRPD